MKASQFLITTLKEAPADAEVVSHQLMMRAGLIKRVGSGIYNYMPMGLRVIRKVEQIVREEMNAAGAVELSMPVIQPADLWQETGRFEKMGDELLRIKDRHDRDFVVQPTSEEVVTDIARQELKSYKHLPKNLYQIQTKFRDERRPRFGLMRGREFIMKDAYSFDRTMEDAKASYQKMTVAYRKIFDRFGLRYRAVAADSGAIGGDLSEEFQVIAATGEDAIVYCPDSNYAANMEKAESSPPIMQTSASAEPAKISTPNMTKCEDIAQHLNVPLKSIVKSIVLATDELNNDGVIVKSQVWLLLIRADHELNEVKVAKIQGLNNGYRPATELEIKEHFGCVPGYLGPVKINFDDDKYFIECVEGVKLIVDREVEALSSWICGANIENHHLRDLNYRRDLSDYPNTVVDIRNVVAGDSSPDGEGELWIERGIEVGHVFYLGTKYSKAMDAKFLDIDGKPKLFEMGCYGIGITRLPAAAIEQNHDERGIIWPDSIAPFTLVICTIDYAKDAAVKATADGLYEALRARGVDVILDDRGERPGIMFAEWELIGVPHRVVISSRGLKDGTVEYQHRKETSATKMAVDELDAFLMARV
jgi:prolyl-tRNA synthetase